MDARTADALRAKYPLGELVIEGKTKKVYAVEGKPSLAILASKNDITAGDGAKHDIIPDKGKLATRTTCNVFRLLKACGLPVAFVEQDSETSFVAECCAMLPYEVVVRREAHGSYLKRNPHLAKGQLFPKLLVEFYLKTSGKRWREHELVCDDPLMLPDASGFVNRISLYDPAKPIHGQEPFLTLSSKSVFSSTAEHTRFDWMAQTAKQTFLTLEKAWQIAGRRLVDFKVEFGFNTDRVLRLADVVDNDSWRVLEDGAYIDKQVYRDGAAISDVAEKYGRVSKITDGFQLPKQRIVLWRASERDSLDYFTGLNGEVDVATVTCSAHKEPVRAIRVLSQLVQDVPDSVIIAYVGRSNGLGPVLAANTSVPIITVPASVREFPDDVWSSLRMPSSVPLMTVLESSNAVLAAKRILAVRNPRLYAAMRGEMEERMENAISL